MLIKKGGIASKKKGTTIKKGDMYICSLNLEKIQLIKRRNTTNKRENYD